MVRPRYTRAKFESFPHANDDFSCAAANSSGGGCCDDGDDDCSSFKWSNRVGNEDEDAGSQDSVVVDVEGSEVITKEAKKLYNKGGEKCNKDMDWKKFEQFLEMLPPPAAAWIRGAAIKAKENGWMDKKY